ncbi:hypothetical protein Bca52824_063122 [Brassica carinata]|uniref:Leucine-rich repeat-containing N-terminal plant-type domain-containing protein n=1 Tax=Brassica carinata TaxID=52824 RepID=A0A8X7QE61_BRACI|nr:hypothetical protein Bca52824_063122 [Brassica carinata]
MFLEAVCNPQDQESLLWFSGNVSSSVSPLNWNLSIDCCSWEGITCDDTSESHVTAISLPLRGLSGNLSSSVQNLHRLSHLDLSHNLLSGPLPPGFFSALDHLMVLNLSYNSFNGELPLEHGSNKFFFPIQTVELSSNLLQGQILNTSIFLLGAFSLISFNVSNNSFTGPIPSFMCMMSSPQLSILDFSYNDFAGQISRGLGRCLNLSVLRAGFNNISGEIPVEIYNLSDLEQLFLPANHLTGKIDNNITRLQPPRRRNTKGHSKLVKLNLRINRLIGNLTELEFSQLKSLRILDLGNNIFTGDVPDKVFSCKSLTAIRQQINKHNWGSQDSAGLSILILAKNFYDETFPSNKDFVSSGGFPKLQIFAIGGCRMRGEVPAWLMKLKSLELMDMSQNRLVGSIPGWLGTLPNLFYIDLSDNLLTGELPKEIFHLRALMSQKVYEATEKNYLPLPLFIRPNNGTANQQYNHLYYFPPAIYIRRNNLTGSIPVEIGQLKALQALELLGNNFSGRIPDELSNLTNLERMDLSNNNLSGRIPSSLRLLHFMSYFNVANNSLEGQIPTGGQFDTFPKSCFEGNPLLCGGVLQTSCTAPTRPHATEDDELKKTLVVGLATGYLVGFSSILLVCAWRVYHVKRACISGVNGKWKLLL